MSNKPVQSPPEILSYAIKVFVPLMNERARMGVLDRSRHLPIGGPPLIGRDSDKAFEDGRKVGVGLKTDGQGNAHQRLSGIAEHLLSAFYPFAKYALMRPAARSGPELRREVHFAQSGNLG